MATYDMSTLHYGDEGPQVKALQKLLNIDYNAGLVVDGKFGSETEAPVKAVQKEYGLTDGGKTRFHFRMEDIARPNVTINFTATVDGGVTIDWGGSGTSGLSSGTTYNWIAFGAE